MLSPWTGEANPHLGLEQRALHHEVGVEPTAVDGARANVQSGRLRAETSLNVRASDESFPSLSAGSSASLQNRHRAGEP